MPATSAALSGAKFIAVLAAVCMAGVTACAAHPSSLAVNSTARAEAARPSASVTAVAATPTGKGKVIAVYEPGYTPAGEKTRQFLEKNKVLDDIAALANARVALPQDVALMGRNCDESNAYWNAQRRDIRFCYEFEESTRKLFEKPDDGKKPSTKDVDEDIVGFANGIVFHELGHALVSLYDLPVTGKEEDAVDQLAVVLLTSGKQRRDDYVTDTINAWGRMASDKEVDKSAADLLDAYSDEHSLNAQRYFNWTCWLYGSDPEAYQSVVQEDEHPDGVLPSARAGQCEDEYKKLSKSWNTLLKPYLKP